MTQLVRRELIRLELASASKDDRVRRFIASTDAVDSYNTTLNPDGWDTTRYEKNPVVALFHGTRWDFPIGTGRAFVEGRKLMLDVTFGPADDPISGVFAEQALRWVDRGVMGASVGFEPLGDAVYNEDRETGDPWIDLWNPPLDYQRQLLHEVSIVTLPANPDAVGDGRQRHVRALERFKLRTAPKPPAPPPAPVVPLVEGLTADQLKAVIREETEKEARAFRARRTGKISGG